MEDKNLLLEELPGASPADHLSARGQLISAGWAVWVMEDGRPLVSDIELDRAAANQRINERIDLLKESGITEIPRFHFGEIFLKG